MLNAFPFKCGVAQKIFLLIEMCVFYTGGNIMQSKRHAESSDIWELSALLLQPTFRLFKSFKTIGSTIYWKKMIFIRQVSILRKLVQQNLPVYFSNKI